MLSRIQGAGIQPEADRVEPLDRGGIRTSQAPRDARRRVGVCWRGIRLRQLRHLRFVAPPVGGLD
jgi:hypothetical protein